MCSVSVKADEVTSFLSMWKISVKRMWLLITWKCNYCHLTSNTFNANYIFFSHFLRFTFKIFTISIFFLDKNDDNEKSDHNVDDLKSYNFMNALQFAVIHLMLTKKKNLSKAEP